MSSLIIHGRHALLFDDDANAAFVNSREALVPFSGEDSCLIDRYDARHLLDRIPPRPVNKNQKYVEDTAGIDQAELDRERFLDLPLDEDCGLPENEYERGDVEISEPKSSNSYQAVGFSYGNNDGSSDQKNTESNDSVFSPPFAVPKDLLNNLMLAAEKKLLQKPCTEKLHQIMARTAIFVSEHGGQSEIVLRVKQGGNPTFGFLMPDNQLHPYFRFLVKHPQLLKHDNTMEKKNSDNGGALSLLGSMYGTGEDDENANDDDSKDESKRSGKEESPSEKGPTMQQAVTYSKEKSSMVPKKSHLIAPSSTGRKKDGAAAKVGKKPDVKPVVLEPPTFLKRNIDKAVEFIQKNGRKFEAKLIEQDKAIGRFPFLLATNQYHSYYLKILEETLESKCSDSNTKRRSVERGRDETVPDELVDDLPFNPHKKEKFTMLLGNNIRREIVDQPSKPVQQSGVTADEAAMIVLAATRGQSPFPGTSTNDSDSKNLSSNKEKTSEINSNVASLSEPTMTNEQKIKAERLKRAKLFAAMIKSGAQPIPSANESKVEGSNHAPLNEPKHEEVNAAEPKLEEFDEASAKERNYRKKNIKEEDDEESDDVHSMKKLHSEDQESNHRHRHSHRHHKHSHYSEDEDEHRKNRRHRHRHRSHRKHSDSDSEEEDDCKDRHRRRSRRKYSESEEEDKHEKSSRHRRRHSKHDLSEDEDQVRSRKHRKKHHRSPLEKEDIEEGELCDVTNAASVKSSDNNGTEVPSDLRAKIRAMLLETL